MILLDTVPIKYRTDVMGQYEVLKTMKDVGHFAQGLKLMLFYGVFKKAHAWFCHQRHRNRSKSVCVWGGGGEGGQSSGGKFPLPSKGVWVSAVSPPPKSIWRSPGRFCNIRTF